MNKFVFVVPMFNASKTLPQMMHSVLGQSYKNWKLHIIDDVSTYDEQEKQRMIIKNFQSVLECCGDDPNKIVVTWNALGRGKSWEVSNVLHGIKLCNDDDIICRLDADDWLIDSDALSILNSVYEQTNGDFIWTAHRWGFSDRNISAHMNDGVDPYKHPWVTSHLKTFRKKLLNNVPYENFCNKDGTLIKRAGDQAVCLPTLYHSKRRIFIPRQMYHYTIDEMGGAVYQTDDAKYQKSEADFLRDRGYVSSGKSWEHNIV